MKQYYIVCVDNNNAPYYYHSDKRFYWNIYDTEKLHIKRWKTLKAARNTFNSIKLGDEFNHLSIMCDDVEDSGHAITTCIEMR